jgi:hypothetical protein
LYSNPSALGAAVAVGRIEVDWQVLLAEIAAG